MIIYNWCYVTIKGKISHKTVAGLGKITIAMMFYYKTSDNVFSDWLLTSLEMFFDKTLYSPH